MNKDLETTTVSVYPIGSLGMLRNGKKRVIVRDWEIHSNGQVYYACGLTKDDGIEEITATHDELFWDKDSYPVSRKIGFNR